MTDTWEVTVTRNGEQVVTIGTNHLSGRDISDADAGAIELAARNLLGFLGLNSDVHRLAQLIVEYPAGDDRPVTKEPT